MNSNLSFCSFSGHRATLGRTDGSSTRAEWRGQEIEQSLKGPTRKDPASDAAKSGVGLISQPCSEGRTGKILVLREMRHTGLREELR